MNLENPLFILLASISLVFLIVGLIMKRYPPKSINGLYGYRTSRSMSNQQNWDFAQTYSAKLMVKIAVWQLIIALACLFISIPEPAATGAGLLIVLTGVAYLIVKTERAIKQLNSVND